MNALDEFIKTQQEKSNNLANGSPYFIALSLEEKIQAQRDKKQIDCILFELRLNYFTIYNALILN